MKYKLGALVCLGTMFWTPTLVADSSEGYINISGNVPAFFELWVRGVPGDLDLSPNVQVSDRLLGILHFKYNLDVQSIVVKSANASGVLTENAAATAWGGTLDFKALGGPTCLTVGGFPVGGLGSVAVPGGAAGIGAGVNIAHPDTTDLTVLGSGIEEDCSFVGSWTGVNQLLPLAGIYSMKIIITMTSF